MGLVDRVKNILITPKTEWDVIAGETTPAAQLITGYVLPLAAVAAVAQFIGSVFVGSGMGVFGTYRVPITWGVAMLVYQVVMAVVMLFVMTFIIDALAPSFGGTKNNAQAMKVAAYAWTPAWVAGILAILPMLGVLAILGALYGLYLIYLGLPRLMKNPVEKSVGYTVVVVICAILVSVVVGAVGAMMVAPSMMMGAAASSEYGAPRMQAAPGSPAGKLDDFARKMEEAGKKMEAAEKSGDPGKQMEAAMGALGAVMGGKSVEPVALDALKPFVPESFAGLPKTASQSERGGVPGLMVAKVEARYTDGAGKNVKLEISDTGGAAGLMGVASWMGVQGEKEDDRRIERTRKEGGRLVHEEISKTGGRNKYSVILASRFVVASEGRGVDIEALKSSVAALDLGKLEALK